MQPFYPHEQYVVPNLAASLLQHLGILYFLLVLLGYHCKRGLLGRLKGEF